ncbi:mitofilin family membrane protein [Inquilinus sp. CAU 1745]|uniref:COG4223 family protein n=1 Tax=Inquilinus sp. CAU 1745 TaxID=3140369 RepID=UPI00325A831E
MVSDSDKPNAPPGGSGPEDPGHEAGTGSPAERVIAAFGGIRPMASKLGIPVTTVQGWKKRQAIPVSRHDDIRAAAIAHVVVLDRADLAASAGPDESPTKEEDKAGHVTDIPTDRPDAPEPEKAPEPPETADIRQEAAVSEAKQARDARSLAGIALGLAILGLLAILTQPLWGPRLAAVMGAGENGAENGAEDSAGADRLAAMEGRLASLDESLQSLASLNDRLAALEAAPAGTDAEALAPLQSAISALGDRIEGLESSRTALDSLTGRVDRLEQTIDQSSTELERVSAALARSEATDSRTQAIVLAVGQIGQALAQGGSFDSGLTALRSVAAGDPEFQQALETLDAHGAQGVAGREELERRFPAMADAVRQAESLPADASWVDQMRASVEGLVTIRPAPGEVEGDDPDAILARAEGRLRDGDLAGAVEALGALQGDAAAAAEEWLAAARARLEAERAVEALNGLAVRRLAGSADAPPPDEPAAEPASQPAEARQPPAESSSSTESGTQ